MDTRRNQPGLFAFLAGLAAIVGGCSGPGATESELRREDVRALPAISERLRRASEPDRPAATIDGKPVMREDLGPLMDEAVGALILREIALDRAVGEACTSRGIKIKESDIEAERTRLLDSIERDAKTEPQDAGVLLERLRRSRGLGEQRFARLLARNAGLRALIKSSVEVTPTEIEQALRIQYGQKFRIRVIVAASEREAVQFREELHKDPATLDVAFARRATVSSIDASSARGGLLDPISPADQTYPETIRSLLTRLEPGTISPVVAVEQGFAIVLLDSRVEGVAPPEGAEKDAAEQVRLRKERIAMEDAARRMLVGMKIVPLDPGLAWSWEAAK